MTAPKIAGILVFDKPKEASSHRVVSLVRQKFSGVKVGHAGTLDPMATGVLPLCLGQATRLAEFIQEQPKVYLAEITLGTETDTEDATGQVLKKSPVPALTSASLKIVLEGFTGAIEQLPPFYSAVKHKGKPLYYWTRKGETPPRRKRQAFIYKIDLLENNIAASDTFCLQVKCSKGTYIRTLAADMGRKIGCGAHLSSLRRMQVGPYSIEEAVSLADFKALTEEELLRKHLKALDTAVCHLPALVLEDSQVDALGYGQQVKLVEEPPKEAEEAFLYRIYRPEGKFSALARLKKSEEGIYLQTEKYFER